MTSSIGSLRSGSLLALLLAASVWRVELALGQGDTPKKKTPVPPAADQAKAEKLIKEIFKEEYEQAEKSVEERRKLAEALAKSARDSGDDVAGRFVLWREARDLASRAGAAALAFSLIKEMSEEFAIDPMDAKAAALALAIPAATSPEMREDYLEVSLDLALAALHEDNFTAARKFVQSVETALAKVKVPDLDARAKKLKEEMTAREKEAEPLNAALGKLKKDAKDADANRDAGEYYGLLRGNWEKALPHLVLGSNKELQTLAQKDLDQPKTGKERVSLGDGWWDLGEKKQDPARRHLRQRAVFWYEKALPDMNGLQRTRLEKRIAQVPRRREYLLPLASEFLGTIGEINRFSFGGPGYWVNRVVFVGDGRHGIAAGGGVILFDLRTGKELNRSHELAYARLGLAISPDGRYFLTGHQNDKNVRLGDVLTGKEVRALEGHTEAVDGVAFSPDGLQAVSGSRDKTLRLWDVKSGKELRQFEDIADMVRCVAFSPKGDRVLSGHSGEGSKFWVRLWDVKTGKEVSHFEGHSNDVTAVAFLPDAKTVLSSSMDGTIRLWDVKSGKELRKMEHEGAVNYAAVSADGRRAVSCGFDDKTVRLWDLATGKELQKFEGHDTRVLGVALSPDGRLAMSSDANYTVRIWRLPR
jgi:hypothetical protein